MLHIFTWWLILQVLGWAALPLAYRLFKWLPGRGVAFARPLGLLLASLWRLYRNSDATVPLYFLDLNLIWLLA